MTDESPETVEPVTDDDGAEDARAARENGEAVDDGGPLTSAEYSIAFSPRNVAIGLAIVAGMIALAARRRRRGRRGGDSDEAL